MTQKPAISRPEWATKHRTPGTELRLLNGKYYLYQYKTVYDRQTSKPRKVSGPLLGRITEKEGLIPSSKRQMERELRTKKYSHIQCKEYGMAQLVMTQFQRYYTKLEELFPDIWKQIVAIAYCRFLYQCPLKSIPFRLANSYLPTLLEFEEFSERESSEILNHLGELSEEKRDYLKSFINKGDYLIMDATDITSHSRLIPLARIGYNSKLQFDPQFNLLYLYDAVSCMPVYYRLLPGNIREVKAFKNTILEAGLKKAVIVADKGFYSDKNISLLQQEKLKFIMPLRRDNGLIPYEELRVNSFKAGDNFFIYENRPIWHGPYITEDKLNLFLYLDESLRVKEEADYLAAISTHPETHSLKDYHTRKDRFGTLSLLTNINDLDGEEVYSTYKTRNQIEVMFDGMKNVLSSDHTYMQNEQTLQGWMFVNHLTMQWYQHLYIELKQKKLLRKISVNDYIQMLTEVKQVRINGTWHLNEYTSHTQKLIKALKIKYA